ncbi:MAG: thioredoxin [Actinomycetota bacterium]|jgi:rhodanese-related sulfurtransferase
MSSSYIEISVSEFAEQFNEEIFLIDVREIDEYLSGHVPGAIHIPLNEVPNRVEEFRNPNGGPTFVICKVGGRSASACDFLANQSLSVINIAGGTMGWIMQGNDVVEGSQSK